MFEIAQRVELTLHLRGHGDSVERQVQLCEPGQIGWPHRHFGQSAGGDLQACGATERLEKAADLFDRHSQAVQPNPLYMSKRTGRQLRQLTHRLRAQRPGGVNQFKHAGVVQIAGGYPVLSIEGTNVIVQAITPAYGRAPVFFQCTNHPGIGRRLPARCRRRRTQLCGCAGLVELAENCAVLHAQNLHGSKSGLRCVPQTHDALR